MRGKVNKCQSLKDQTLAEKLESSFLQRQQKIKRGRNSPNALAKSFHETGEGRNSDWQSTLRSYDSGAKVGI